MKGYFENDLYVIPFDKVMYVQRFNKPYVYVDVKFALSVRVNNNDFVEKISLRDEDSVRFLEEFRQFCDRNNA